MTLEEKEEYVYGRIDSLSFDNVTETACDRLRDVGKAIDEANAWGCRGFGEDLEQLLAEPRFQNNIRLTALMYMRWLNVVFRPDSSVFFALGGTLWERYKRNERRKRFSVAEQDEEADVAAELGMGV